MTSKPSKKKFKCIDFPHDLIIGSGSISITEKKNKSLIFYYFKFITLTLYYVVFFFFYYYFKNSKIFFTTFGSNIFENDLLLFHLKIKNHCWPTRWKMSTDKQYLYFMERDFIIK